jgi:hypothetical protein
MSETIEVTMKLPKLPPGKRYTGEFRQVRQSDQFFDSIQESVAFWPHSSASSTRFLIVVDVYQRPGWMKSGWLYEGTDGWWWSDSKPVLVNGLYVAKVASQFYHVASKISNTRLEFTPPVYTGGPENSLTEVV